MTDAWHVRPAGLDDRDHRAIGYSESATYFRKLLD